MLQIINLLQPLIKKRKYGEDPSIYKAKLEAIEAKISAKKTFLEQSVKFAGLYIIRCCFQGCHTGNYWTYNVQNINLQYHVLFVGAKYMTRHEMDLENSISHDQQKAKSLSILMTDVKPEDDFKDDPMNNIKELLEKVEQGKSKTITKPSATHSDASDGSDSDDSLSKASCLTFKEFMKKTKQELSDKKVVDISQDECPDCARSTIECYYHSRRKKQDGCATVDYNNDSVNEITYKAKRKKKHKKKQKREKTSYSERKEIKETVANVKLDPIPLEVIEKYRITLDEIKHMDRFTDYSPGQPNKVNRISESLL